MRSVSGHLLVVRRREAEGAVAAEGSDALRFCARFAALATVGFTALALLPDASLAPYLQLLAAAAAACLELPGLGVLRDGTRLAVDGFAVRVEGECSALYEAVLLGAAIAASPESLRQRLAGIAAGFAVLLTVNVLRIASLVLIGALVPGWFTHAHLFVWQALLVATIATCWLAWLARPRDAAQG